MTKQHMPFSKRYGYVKVSDKIQLLGINTELRTALWNYVYLTILKGGADPLEKQVSMKNILMFCRFVYVHFLNKPLDEFPLDYCGVLRGIILEGQWYKVYDFLEFISAHKKDFGYARIESFEEIVNIRLSQYNSGYRFVEGLIAPITNPQEIATVEEAINQSPYDGIKTHLHSALEKLSDKENPDYRNSIKESISAVEVYVREITGESTLGKAIDKLETNGVEIPKILHTAIEKLYAFTNDANGVRHALMDESNISKEEAYFMLIACSSFVNYLKYKEAKIK